MSLFVECKVLRLLVRPHVQWSASVFLQSRGFPWWPMSAVQNKSSMNQEPFGWLAGWLAVCVFVCVCGHYQVHVCYAMRDCKFLLTYCGADHATIVFLSICVTVICNCSSFKPQQMFCCYCCSLISGRNLSLKLLKSHWSAQNVQGMKNKLSFWGPEPLKSH